ncbi:hypothetical protein [Hathewaya limosa]|uniref:Flagellar biosynthesis protein FliR n=1 Tax=Hathewaya limosa TaxID=1536 RepID=A0ABU0JUF1_HATLI|nr:hypothetical protein [Hathewaya limosa]AWZ47637.1 hypothetical protein C3495_01715 [Clostridiaceae bacterium 14S0207]MDQ0480733.1 flagellar biosynthesis protein FliR [Hathewaya limosa]
MKEVIKENAKNTFKDRLIDFNSCFILSLKVSLIPIIIGIIVGIIVGLVKKDLTYLNVLYWVYAFATYISCLGLVICAIAFMSPKHMEKLNHQKQWERYFKVFGLIKVIGYTSTFILIYSLILDIIIFYLKHSI